MMEENKGIFLAGDRVRGRTNAKNDSITFYSQSKTSKYSIHWNINILKIKFLYEKSNGNVEWNKHSGEQY